MAPQYCSFYVGDLYLGLEVERVQEVLHNSPITPVPTAPPAVRGLINLRGQIVTAIDLRKRFGLAEADESISPTMLVLDAEDGLLALVVDSAGDVEEVAQNRFEEPPATLKGESRRLIRGACKLEKNLMLVLDADHVFDLENNHEEAQE